MIKTIDLSPDLDKFPRWLYGRLYFLDTQDKAGTDIQTPR